MRAVKINRRSGEIVRAAMQAACEVFNRPMSDMTSRARPEYIVWPRQIAMALCARKRGVPIIDIARLFKHDRGTVTHAWVVVNNRVNMLTSSAGDYAAVAFRFEQLISGDVDPVAVATTG